MNLSEHINSDLVSVARSQLNASSTMMNEYAQLRANGIATLGTTSLQDLLQENNTTLYISHYQLPRLFTVQGWRQFMLPAIQQLSQSNNKNDDWVISMPLTLLANPQNISDNHLASPAIQSNKKLADQIQQLYFADYINVWSNFLSSIYLQRFSSLDDAIKKLQALSEPNSEYIAQTYQVINAKY